MPIAKPYLQIFQKNYASSFLTPWPSRFIMLLTAPESAAGTGKTAPDLPETVPAVQAKNA